MNMHVIFVAPFCMETTLRFVRGAATLPGVNLSLISQERAETLPPDLRSMLAGHWRVQNALDPEQLAVATRALETKSGPVKRLIGALEQLQVPLARAREILGIDGLKVEAARNFRDKARMKDVLRKAGVPCARHALVQNLQQAQAFADKAGFPLVAKPPAGAGGKGTYRIDTFQDLDILLHHYAPSSLEPIMLEEFVSGTEHSFDSIVINGKPVWHSISRYMPAPLQVLENPWIQWCVFLPRDISGEEFAPIRDGGFKAVEALGLRTGLSHMEWFRLDDDRIAISEVGARPPGAQITSLLSWAHDLDFYQAWPRLMIFDEFDPPERRHAVGAAYFRGQRNAWGGTRVRAIHGLDEAQKRFGHLVVETRLPSAGQFASDSYEGEGYVIIRDTDSSVVEEALKQIVGLVRVELA
ncbi:MAG: ATP-grasp domain-containing protein [Lysobacterales bacterium]